MNDVWNVSLTGNVEKLVDLLEKSPHLIDAPDICRTSPMYFAASRGHILIIKTLVQKGSTAIDTPNSSGWTPLHAMAMGGHDSAIELIVELGSEALDALDQYNRTPISIAMIYANWTCVATLKMLGANPAIGATYALTREQHDYLYAPMDENEIGKTRYRVYFQRSLVDRLLFQLTIVSK